MKLQDRTNQSRQNKDHTFQEVFYGDTEFAGDCVRDREIIVSRIFDICILIEGKLFTALTYGIYLVLEFLQFSQYSLVIVSISVFLT